MCSTAVDVRPSKRIYSLPNDNFDTITFTKLVRKMIYLRNWIGAVF
jgi:hypothetical protein